MTAPAPACEHGSPARFVFVTDERAKSAADPYGDVYGPMGVDLLASAELVRSELQAEEEPGQYGLAFIHADHCRTEEA